MSSSLLEMGFELEKFLLLVLAHNICMYLNLHHMMLGFSNLVQCRLSFPDLLAW